MNIDQNEIASHRTKNLNIVCTEQQLLFSEFDNDDSIDNEEVYTVETERMVKEIPKTKLIRFSSFSKMIWDRFLLVLVIYSCLVIPFDTAFFQNQSIISVIVDLFIDLFFVADFFLCFFTTFIDKHGKETFKLRKIAKNYITGKFFIDIISTFPIDKFLMLSSNDYSSIITVICFLKVLRLRRMNLLSMNREQLLFRFFQIIMNLIIIVHIAGCIWFIIVSRSETWVPYDSTQSNSTSLYSDSVWTQFSISYYEGIWLILGQEIVPSDTTETWVASVFIALGTIITSFIFGEMLMFTLRLGLKYEIRKKALDQSLSILGTLNVSADIREKILDFITHTYPTLSSQKEFEKLCHYISPVLQKKVMEFIYKPIFTTNYLFEDDSKLSKFIINRVLYNFYQPEQDIITEGTRASDFYFLVKGVCSVYVKSKEGKKIRVTHLLEGTHFGEIGLLYKTYRTATVSSHDYSTVAHLGKHEFRVLTNVFPYIIDKLKIGIAAYKDPWKNFILSVFNQINIFDGIPIEVFEELIYKMKIFKVQKGDFLFKQGESMKGIYAVASGTFQISIVLNSSDTLKENPKLISCQSVRDTDNQEGEKMLVKIPIADGQKIKAEIVPIIISDETEDEIRINTNRKEVEITYLKSGTLLYPTMALHKGRLHKLQCKAIENSSVYLLDLELIKYLIKEHEDFKKVTETYKGKNDYLEFYNAEQVSDFYRFMWKKAITTVVLRNRENKAQKQNKMKDMLNIIKSIVACEKAGNHKLAEDVVQGKISYKFITSDGELDTALMYEGALPASHPIMKAFDSHLAKNSNTSMIKQCNLLSTEILNEVPKIKKCRQIMSNNLGLVDTLIQQLKNK